MLLGLVSTVSAEPLAACPETWSARGLADVVVSADLDMAKLDTDGFLAARDLLLRRLTCVNEPLSGPVVGAVHRVVATAAFLEKRDTRIAPALAGLLSADPGYQLTPTLYPEGHPIRGLLPHGAILARDTSVRPLAALASGWLEVDGLATTRAPGARAAVVQQVDAQGAVVETRYVWPDDDLGSWTGAAGARVASLPRERVGPAPARPARAPMIVATASSLVATGVLYGLASGSRAAFRDTSVERSEDDLVALRETTNGLTIGWVATGATAVGLGVGLAFAW